MGNNIEVELRIGFTLRSTECTMLGSLIEVVGNLDYFFDWCNHENSINATLITRIALMLLLCKGNNNSVFFVLNDIST